MDYYAFILLAVMLSLILWWSFLIVSGLKVRSFHTDQKDELPVRIMDISADQNAQVNLPCSVSSDVAFTTKGTVIATEGNIAERMPDNMYHGKRNL